MPRSLLSRTGRALPSQAVALLALCLAVSGGTAYAVASKNSVVSSSIKDRNVRTADLANGAVTTQKVADGKLKGVDLANGTVTADKIDQSGLGTVPLATQGGLGRISTLSTCNPENATPTTCATVVVPMPSAGRLLITGSIAFRNDSGSGPADGVCLLAVDGTSAGETEMLLQSGDTAGRPTIVPALHLTSKLAKGNHTVTLRCTENTATGTVQLTSARVTAVALGDK